jgi:hypothetical protein
MELPKFETFVIKVCVGTRKAVFRDFAKLLDRLKSLLM